MQSSDWPADDDDDDDDVDLSNYDVGTIEEPPLPSPPPPPPPEPLPRVGSIVQARYSRRWQPATVLAVDAKTRVLDVRFVGYHDTVRVGQSCWECKPSSSAEASHEDTSYSDMLSRHATSSKRARDEGRAEEADELSASERAMLTRCVAARTAADDDDGGDAPIPGAPLPETSIGHRLLEKMGWKPGEGLGVAGDGNVLPVSETLKAQDGRGGLRAAHERTVRR